MMDFGVEFHNSFVGVIRESHDENIISFNTANGSPPFRAVYPIRNNPACEKANHNRRTVRLMEVLSIQPGRDCSHTAICSCQPVTFPLYYSITASKFVRLVFVSVKSPPSR